MMRTINTSVRLFAEVFDPAGPVVEMTSYHPVGFEYLPGREYVGCDLREGNGVDPIEGYKV